MKILISLLLVFSLNIFAVQENEQQSAQDKCSVIVGANDTMLFDTKIMKISKSCQNFSVTLTHNGKGAKQEMGHNLVIAKVSDLEKIALEGSTQGLENDYLMPNDQRIIAHTKMLEGGETDTITFATNKFLADEEYGYICTYRGHFILMRGKIEFVD